MFLSPHSYLNAQYDHLNAQYDQQPQRSRFKPLLQVKCNGDQAETTGQIFTVMGNEGRRLLSCTSVCVRAHVCESECVWEF